MEDKRQIAWGVLSGIALSGVLEVVPDCGISLLACMAIVTAVGLFGGRRLPPLVRVLFTVLIFYFGGTAAVCGRTMAPGLTHYTLNCALGFFALCALLPSLTLLRLWTGPLRVLFIASVLPVSLALAFTVAGLEEFMFVQKHKAAGVGPTARWTVSNHWLSHNAKTGALDGSDRRTRLVLYENR